MNKILLTSAVASVVLLMGCTTTKKPVPTAYAADSFVQQEMKASVQSIEQDLRVLVDLSKGDVAPRHPSAIGSTVAGAVAARPAPLEPAPISSAQDRAMAEKALDTRIRIQWTGPADGLLGDLAKTVGFQLHDRVKGNGPVVSIRAENITIRDVLARVSEQLPRHQIETKSEDRSIHFSAKP